MLILFAVHNKRIIVRPRAIIHRLLLNSWKVSISKSYQILIFSWRFFSFGSSNICHLWIYNMFSLSIGSCLVPIITCLLFSAKPLPANQWWVIVNWTRRNKQKKKKNPKYNVKCLQNDGHFSCTNACALQWRHNERDGVSNHQPHDCLLNRLFRHRWKKTSKLRATDLCAENLPVTGEFPAQRASNAENVSIWWRHHDSDLRSCHRLVFSHLAGAYNILGNNRFSLRFLH